MYDGGIGDMPLSPPPLFQRPMALFIRRLLTSEPSWLFYMFLSIISLCLIFFFLSCYALVKVRVVSHDYHDFDLKVCWGVGE
jgi:hypothetical protein